MIVEAIFVIMVSSAPGVEKQMFSSQYTKAVCETKIKRLAEQNFGSVSGGRVGVGETETGTNNSGERNGTNNHGWKRVIYNGRAYLSMDANSLAASRISGLISFSS